MTLEVSFADLNDSIDVITSHHEETIRLSRKAASLFRGTQGSNYMRVSYSDIVCAQERLGPGHLPENVAAFVGLGDVCSTAPASITSVKSSPPNPALALRNLPEMTRQARKKKVPWANHLSQPKEALCDEATPSFNTRPGLALDYAANTSLRHFTGTRTVLRKRDPSNGALPHS